MDGLTIGRMVHYVTGVYTGGELDHYAATVVDVINKEEGIVTLAVFNKKIFTAGDILSCIWFAPETPYSEEPIEISWHWIERA